MSICKLFDCEKCDSYKDCGGCEKCNGRPFDGSCIIANTILKKGEKAYLDLKKQLIQEINELNIPELHVDDLNALGGVYVNLEYPLANNTKVKFLNDKDIYLGNQIERKNNERCYGVVANEKFILVSEYGCNGEKPELVLFKKR